MKKTILSLVMMLTMALVATAGPKVTVHPGNKATAGKTQVEFKGDSLVVNDGDESVTVSGIPELQKVRDKINEALDDTLATGDAGSISIGDDDMDLSPEDLKAMSEQWADVAKKVAYASILGLLALVLLILLFRYLNRRSKYRVMERAIENNYPLNDISLTDNQRRAIYVQQPVVTASTPMAAAPQQPGQVPVGTPIQGQTPANPIVMTSIFNWRALMPAIRVAGWGVLLALFGIFVCDGHDPFTYIGLALMFVGLCKGFILYKEQKELHEAALRAQDMQPRRPVTQGTPMPPPMDDDYREDNEPYQPY